MNASANASDDTDAMESLITTRYDHLWRHLRMRVASDDEAQDLAQEACLLMLQARNRDRIRNPSAYLYRIAHNLLYQYYLRKSQAKLVDADDIDLPCLRPSVEERVSEAVRQQLVQRTMQELSPKCRRVAALRWREGLPIAEIAECMRLSRGMVKKYLANSISHCRRRLGSSILADRLASGYSETPELRPPV